MEHKIYFICQDEAILNKKLHNNNNIEFVSPYKKTDYDITYYNLIWNARKCKTDYIIICDDKKDCNNLNYNNIKNYISDNYDIYYHNKNNVIFTIFNKSSYNTICSWSPNGNLSFNGFINTRPLVFKNNYRIISLYMNCHAEEIIRYLKTIKQLESCIFYHLITYELINKDISDDKFKKITSIINSSEIIIYNPVKEEHKIWYYKNILKYKNKNSQTIQIPFTRFNGYWIKSMKISHSHKNMFHYGLPSSMLDLFIKDNISKNTLKHKIKKDLEYVKTLYEQSDINMYNFIFNNYKKTKLFLNYEHPTTLFFKELTLKILDKIGIKYDDLKLFKNEHLDMYEQPILPWIIKSLQLEFVEKKLIKFHNYNIELSDYYKLFLCCNYISEYQKNRDIELIFSKLKITFNKIIPGIFYDDQVKAIF
jgi:hypothetical protein